MTDTMPETMSSRQAIALVVEREVRSRLFSRPFVIGLLTTVVMIFGFFAVFQLIDRDDAVTIGLTGPQPPGAEAAVESLADLDGTTVTFETFADRAAAEQALTDGELDIVVADGDTLIMWRIRPSLVTLLTPAYGQVRLTESLSDAGLSAEEIGTALNSASDLAVVELDVDPDRNDREGVAFAIVILLFVAIQLSGAYMLFAVFEEKTSKVVELVLSSISARDLLAGKIIGIGVLGTLQVVVLGGTMLAASALFGSSILSTISPGLLALSVVWFLLGYLLYGAVFAAGASLAPRQEDAQSTLAPVSVILLASYGAAAFTTAAPESFVARAVAWIPFVSPFAMPGRIASGDALWWEVVGALVVTGLTAALVTRAAARIYIRSVIHTDRTLSWREAWSLTN